MQNAKMYKVTTDDIFQRLANSMPVRWNPDYHEELLDPISRLMFHMSREHTSVFLTRIDIYYNAHPSRVLEDKNPLVSRFCEMFTQYGQPNGIDIKYFWTRAFDSYAPTTGCQYHLLFLIDGDKIHDTLNVWRKVSELWHLGFDEVKRGGKIYLREPRGEDHCRGGIMIHRDYPHFRENFSRGFQWVSSMVQRSDKNGRRRYFNGHGLSPIPEGSLVF